MINIDTYKDLSLMAPFVEEVTFFAQKSNLAKFFIDVGEINEDVGQSINWKAIVVWDKTGSYTISDDLQDQAALIINLAKDIPGLQRITINFLGPMALMPMHRDSEVITSDYNMIIPVTDNGWFFLDNRVIKSKKHDMIVFDGCVLHGVMNDSFEERISIYLLIEKSRFNDSP